MELPGSERSLIWVPSRRHLKHSVFKLPDQLPAAKRADALRLQVLAWAPNETPDFAVAWLGSQASVYAWDSNETESEIRAAGYDPGLCDIVPETMIRKPGTTGALLVEMADGYEGQIWNDGFLRLTRWWQNIPSTQDWRMFRRTGRIPEDPHDDTSGPPTPIQPAWLEEPWAGSLKSNRFLRILSRDRSLLATAAAVLIAPCIFFGAQWLTYAYQDNGVIAKIDDLESQSIGVRQERSRALQALEEVETIMGLQAFPQQFHIYDEAHRLLSELNITLVSWDYRSGSLSFGLESQEDLDPTVLIATFENSDMFFAVSSTTRGRGENQALVLDMRVEPLYGANP